MLGVRGEHRRDQLVFVPLEEVGLEPMPIPRPLLPHIVEARLLPVEEPKHHIAALCARIGGHRRRRIGRRAQKVGVVADDVVVAIGEKAARGRAERCLG